MRPEVEIVRKNVYEFITKKIFLDSIVSPVLEIGPMQKKWTPLEKYFVDTKNFFESKNIEYISNDIDKNSNSQIICDLLDINNHIENGSIGTIIALEVLEHISQILKVCDVFCRLLKPNGKIYITTPYYFYHHSPFPDYWRVSHDGLKLLFEEKFEIEISSLHMEDDRKPIHHTMIGIKI
jgi:SAM-dependent methyltransferase